MTSMKEVQELALPFLRKMAAMSIESGEDIITLNIEFKSDVKVVVTVGFGDTAHGAINAAVELIDTVRHLEKVQFEDESDGMEPRGEEA